MTDPNLERDAMISRMQQAVAKGEPKSKKPLEPKKPMSAEEIQSKIEDLARSGEGADQRWALRHLSGQQTSSIVLPEPLTDEERIERFARIARSQGPEITRLGYVRAFPNAKKAVDQPRSDPPEVA